MFRWLIFLKKSNQSKFLRGNFLYKFSKYKVPEFSSPGGNALLDIQQKYGINRASQIVEQAKKSYI